MPYGKVKDRMATITGLAPTDVVPAQSGYALEVVQVIAANQQNNQPAITLYEQNEQVTPAVALPASGTWILDDWGGEGKRLAIGSGLRAALHQPGSVKVTAYYRLRDETPGIAKSDARKQTYLNTHKRTRSIGT